MIRYGKGGKGFECTLQFTYFDESAIADFPM